MNAENTFGKLFHYYITTWMYIIDSRTLDCSSAPLMLLEVNKKWHIFLCWYIININKQINKLHLYLDVDEFRCICLGVVACVLWPTCDSHLESWVNSLHRGDFGSISGYQGWWYTHLISCLAHMCVHLILKIYLIIVLSTINHSFIN